VVSCASLQIGNFVQWLQQQSFYENTTVVLLGDHLMMNDAFTPEMDRKPLNIFINSALEAPKGKNRVFTPFDIYPTIVESMGAQIDGHRLGFGTSLLSDEPTLTESEISV
jgi:phosphoglycerol transferase